MTYQTTITERGQITIPKYIREAFKMKPFQRIIVDFEKDKREIRLKPAEDFLEVAKKIKVRKKVGVLQARESLENHYERI